jgi:sacsin
LAPQFNDAEFSDSDFLNLARIGQGSKLQRASTTGRFGLGFNSVYHFTDLPTIVSAGSIGARRLVPSRR